MENLSTQLALDETEYLLKKEVELEAMVFFRAYSHWALKRAFFFSLLRCQNYLNVSFRIRGYREDISIRWGSGANLTYPVVRILFSTIKNEFRRHPFMRRTRHQDPDSVFVKRLKAESTTTANATATVAKKKGYSGNNNIWAILMAGGSLAGKPGIIFS